MEMDPEGSRRLALGGGWARGSRGIGEGIPMKKWRRPRRDGWDIYLDFRVDLFI